jgi:hypothetical protein
MKRIWIILIVLASGLVLSCEKSSSELCGGDAPEKTLPWLKQMTDSLSTSPYCFAISRAVYKKQTVFISMTCDPLLDGVPFLYNCEGQKLNLSADDYRELKFTGPMEPIWKNRDY